MFKNEHTNPFFILFEFLVSTYMSLYCVFFFKENLPTYCKVMAKIYFLTENGAL